jgi:hydroxymethylbilane synthase
VPIGAYAEIGDKQIRLRGMVGRPDGSEILREQAQARHPEELGREVAHTLLRRGAEQILKDVYTQEVAVPRQP